MPGLFPEFPQVFPFSPQTLATLGKVVAGLSGIPIPELVAIAGLEDSIKDGSLLKALPLLVSQGHLPAEVLNDGFDFSSLVGTSGLLKKFLDWSKKPSLAGAFSLLSQDRCGATTIANPTNGQLKPPQDGRFPIVFQVKEIDGKMPVPRLKESFSENEIKAILVNALNLWAGHLNIDLVSTADENEANLLISGRRGGFGADVVAVGDIGPLSKKKCRLIFNLDVSLSLEEFMYAVAHEFGHTLGIRHADVPQTGALMSPVLDLGKSGLAITPTEHDFKAATEKNTGWKWDGIVDQ